MEQELQLKLMKIIKSALISDTARVTTNFLKESLHQD